MTNAPRSITETRFNNEIPQAVVLKSLEPNYDIKFLRGEKVVGELDFNGPEMVFTGDFEGSAKIFFEIVAGKFAGRLRAEFQAGRESSDDLVEAVETLLSVIDSGVVDISPDLVSVMRVRRHLEELK